MHAPPQTPIGHMTPVHFPAAPPMTPPPHRPRQRGEVASKTVQTLLLSLGGLLVAAAIVIFTAVAWRHMGDGGRLLVLGAFTALMLAVPAVLIRFRLWATAETFARAVHLRAPDRKRLQRARIDLGEARARAESGEFATAGESAERAFDGAEHLSRKTAQAAARLSDPGLVRRWRKWIDETIGWSRRTGRTAIIVSKDANRLTLYKGGAAVRRRTGSTIGPLLA